MYCVYGFGREYSPSGKLWGSGMSDCRECEEEMSEGIVERGWVTLWFPCAGGRVMSDDFIWCFNLVL